MGQIGACACQGTVIADHPGGEALLEAKIEKKKPQVTRIRNRISSIINPLKLPKFEQPITPTTARLSFSKPPRKADKLILTCDNPDKPIVFDVPKQSTGTLSFQLGTCEDLQPPYKIHAEQEKDSFRMSVKYTEVVNSNNGEEEGCFFLRDEAVGLGSFYRIKPKEMVPVVSSMLINVGNQFIVPYLGSGSALALKQSNWGEKRTFQLKVYGGCANGETVEVGANEGDCSVAVGRSRTNRLVLNDPLLSKTQCKFVRKNGKWYLLDGGDHQKDGSTNGTWVYMGNLTKVVEGMELRCGSFYFTCNLNKDQ